jgi:hypothetical protein
MWIRESPLRALVVFRHRNITIEFSRLGEHRSSGSRLLLGSVWITATRDEGTENRNILQVDEPVLVHVNLPNNFVGRAEGVTKKCVEPFEIFRSPFPIAVQIAQHDQFGPNLHSVDRDSQLPIRVSQGR